MRRVRLTVGYDGTDFFGSQSQASRRTVQSELERMLQRIAPGSRRTVFAGRTDRGVHAVGQVVSVDVEWKDSDQALRNALNAVGPVDIVVSDVATAHPTFHARYDATAREYRYRLCVAATPPVLKRRYVWWRSERLDPDLAAAASEHFVGEHRFGCFAGSGRSQALEPERLIRVVYECDWKASAAADGERHEFRVVANGFLPQMARNMVAALVQVARSARPIEWIDELLATNDRGVLGEAAPPQGLVLWQVSYAGDGNVATGSGTDGKHGER
jgi:tRNA pseudouridine38-40 synthase